MTLQYEYEEGRWAPGPASLSVGRLGSGQQDAAPEQLETRAAARVSPELEQNFSLNLRVSLPRCQPRVYPSTTSGGDGYPCQNRIGSELS